MGAFVMRKTIIPLIYFAITVANYIFYDDSFVLFAIGYIIALLMYPLISLCDKADLLIAFLYNGLYCIINYIPIYNAYIKSTVENNFFPEPFNNIFNGVVMALVGLILISTLIGLHSFIACCMFNIREKMLGGKRK